MIIEQIAVPNNLDLRTLSNGKIMLDVKLVSKVVKCFIPCLDIIEFIPLRYIIKTLKFSFMHTEQHRATYRYFIYANCMTNQINLVHQPDLSTWSIPITFEATISLRVYHSNLYVTYFLFHLLWSPRIYPVNK